MSCFSCYSSHKINSWSIDKVLEQGQRLRSAMVQAIISNDPLSLNLNEGLCSPLKTSLPETKIRAFLKGDAMSREDELQALETLRSMSAADLCKVTDRTYKSEERCDYSPCVEYSRCGRSPQSTSNQITKKIQEKYKKEAGLWLRFVDSVRVSVGAVTLNQAGDKKLLDSLRGDRAALLAQTFFLEYQLPDILTKTKSKTGVNPNNIVRVCTRRSQLQAPINFKQTSIHDVGNIHDKLDAAVIAFKLSFRNFRQKNPIQLGVAHFNFSIFELMKNFTCSQELVLKLQGDSPIVVGGLKVTVQLGCGRLYFGKEFIEAVSNNKENALTLDSERSESISPVEFIAPPKPFKAKSECVITKPELVSYRPKPKSEPNLTKPHKAVFVPSLKPKSVCVITKPELVSYGPRPEPEPDLTTPLKQVLVGFVYVGEAHFSRKVLNSFLTCNLFGQNENVSSRLVGFNSNPNYNFIQRIPLIYDDEFLAKLRENHMILEFFEREKSHDFCLGITPVSLHPFYLAFRNLTVLKYLSEKQVPVISVDGWESIIDPSTSTPLGQVHIVVALGTNEQIQTLKQDNFKQRRLQADVGVQSDMEPQNSINTFLKELVVKKETSTNTEPQVEVRSTSNLLDSLEKALTDGSPKEKPFFKAHVAIINALHLPSRKKCKSRKSKGTKGKHEDILPSTYVTFEGCKNDMKITQIIPKSTSPKWDFRTDVFLPVELLTNGQKFLVFKVWRKSTNTTLTPNMQTDHVIGFATVDLSAILAGLPTIQGWYNINDLSNKCNGQINIHVTPLESIEGFQACKEPVCCESDVAVVSPMPEEPNEMLNRALKRKFTELDEITQRLRLRLSKVTDESDTSNDEMADEFERDINSLCVEDDFDTIDFKKEALHFNLNHAKEAGLLQTQPDGEGNRQKIDMLLEKLTLISTGENSRYVSGCSDKPSPIT